MKQIEVVARSASQALEIAARQLEVSPDDVEVLEEYEPDELDLQNLAEEEASLSEGEKEGEPVLYVVRMGLKKPMEGARQWIEGLVQRFQPGATVKLFTDEGNFVATIEADDPSIFIGKQGHTLAALQHIVTRVVPRRVEGCPPVSLDVGDYRDRKKEQLERVAENAARRAMKTRKNVTLRPMPSTDRKFIHNMLKDFRGVQTSSHGQEPQRYIVVEAAGGQRDHSRGRGGGRRGGGGGNRFERGGNRHEDDNRGNRIDYEERRGGGFREKAPREEFRPAYGEMEMPAPHHYQDIDIEETPSRMPSFNQRKFEEQPAGVEGEQPLVDELVDELIDELE